MASTRKRARHAEPLNQSLLTPFFQRGGAGPSQPPSTGSGDARRDDAGSAPLATEEEQMRQAIEASLQDAAGGSDLVECPMCMVQLTINTVEEHAANCTGAEARRAEQQDQPLFLEELDNGADAVSQGKGPDATGEAECACTGENMQDLGVRETARDLGGEETPESEDLAEAAAMDQDAAVKTEYTPDDTTDIKNRHEQSASQMQQAGAQSRRWQALFSLGRKGQEASPPSETPPALTETDDAKPTEDAKPARRAPFYKILDGMPLSVDAFRYGRIQGCTGYFLTHFHSDHYGGLSARWEHGPIYCSAPTADLVRLRLGVDPRWLRPLPMDEPVEIPDSGGVRVTCIDANHCPGSCIMLFEGRQTAHILPYTRRSPHIGSARIFRYLHCGDFRACPAQIRHPALANGPRIDIVYLDTTYLNPRYCFPAQEEVVRACVQLAQMLDRGNPAELASLRMRAPERLQTSKSVQPPSVLQRWLGRRGGEQEGEMSDVSGDSESSVPSGASRLGETPSEQVQGLDHPNGAARQSLSNASNTPDASAPATSDAQLLILVGTYSIGKEKLVKALAKDLGTRIYCLDPRKHQVYEHLHDPELEALLTRDPLQARVHVLNMFALSASATQEWLATLRSRGAQLTHAVAFRPTGWTYRPTRSAPITPDTPLEQVRQIYEERNFGPHALFPTRDSTPEMRTYGVPYSEHSSFVRNCLFYLC